MMKENRKIKNKISPNYSVVKFGRVLEPDITIPDEAGGVFNPASLQINQETIYIYYRGVQEPNYSRLKLATAIISKNSISFDKENRVIMEPETRYEVCEPGVSGGVEDPRISEIEGKFYMAYVGRGESQKACPTSRAALAVSTDGMEWKRLGRFIFEPFHNPNLKKFNPNYLDNKDVALFPKKFGNTYVALQRFSFEYAAEKKGAPKPGIWLSYSKDLINWYNLKPLYFGNNNWENVKVGAGTPPVLTKYGWMIIYHGIEGESDTDPNREYKAGVIFLDKDDPEKIIFVSKHPLMSPQQQDEKFGVVNNVVFPTAIFKLPKDFVFRDTNFESGETYGVLYGMADARTGFGLFNIN